MIKAIIFDCFGVIISDGLHALAAELYPDAPEALSEAWGLVDKANRGLMSSEDLSTQIAPIFGLSVADYRARVDLGEVKDDALLRYVTELRKTYRTALLSNIPKGSLLPRFTQEELNRYFDTVIVSAEIGYAKPEPQVYEITASRLTARLDECVFTDDRQHYLEGAQAVGMHTILYQDFKQFRRELEALLTATDPQ